MKLECRSEKDVATTELDMIQGMNTVVYVVTHKDFDQDSLPDGYVPILAGADSNYADIRVKDNTGNNISGKNSSYCELTAQYWVWKNSIEQSEDIGFVHYRRFFYRSTFTDEIVPSRQLGVDLEQYDVILPEPTYFTKTVREQYVSLHHKEDLEVIYAVLHSMYPEYEDAFNAVMDGYGLSCYNMFVMSSTKFDQYMAWLFSILLEAENQIDISNYDSYNQRIYGFLGERLLNIWVKHNNLRIKYYPVFKNGDNRWRQTITQRIKRTLRKRK